MVWRYSEEWIYWAKLLNMELPERGRPQRLFMYVATLVLVNQPIIYSLMLSFPHLWTFSTPYMCI